MGTADATAHSHVRQRRLSEPSSKWPYFVTACSAEKQAEQDPCSRLVALSNVVAGRLTRLVCSQILKQDCCGVACWHCHVLSAHQEC